MQRGFTDNRRMLWLCQAMWKLVGSFFIGRRQTTNHWQWCVFLFVFCLFVCLFVCLFFNCSRAVFTLWCRYVASDCAILENHPAVMFWMLYWTRCMLSLSMCFKFYSLLKETSVAYWLYQYYTLLLVRCIFHHRVNLAKGTVNNNKGIPRTTFHCSCHTSLGIFYIRRNVIHPHKVYYT